MSDIAQYDLDGLYNPAGPGKGVAVSSIVGGTGDAKVIRKVGDTWQATSESDESFGILTRSSDFSAIRTAILHAFSTGRNVYGGRSGIDTFQYPEGGTQSSLVFSIVSRFGHNPGGVFSFSETAEIFEIKNVWSDPANTIHFSMLIPTWVEEIDRYSARASLIYPFDDNATIDYDLVGVVSKKYMTIGGSSYDKYTTPVPGGIYLDTFGADQERMNIVGRYNDPALAVPTVELMT